MVVEDPHLEAQGDEPPLEDLSPMQIPQRQSEPVCFWFCGHHSEYQTQAQETKGWWGRGCLGKIHGGCACDRGGRIAEGGGFL